MFLKADRDMALATSVSPLVNITECQMARFVS